MPGGLGGIGSIASLASSAGGGKGGSSSSSQPFTPPVNPALASNQVGAQYADYGMYNSTPRLIDQLGAVNMASLTNAQAAQNFNLQQQQLQNQANLLGGEVSANQQGGGTGGTSTTQNDPANLGTQGGGLATG